MKTVNETEIHENRKHSLQPLSQFKMFLPVYVGNGYFLIMSAVNGLWGGGGVIVWSGG